MYLCGVFRLSLLSLACEEALVVCFGYTLSETNKRDVDRGSFVGSQHQKVPRVGVRPVRSSSLVIKSSLDEMNRIMNIYIYPFDSTKTLASMRG